MELTIERSDLAIADLSRVIQQQIETQSDPIRVAAAQSPVGKVKVSFTATIEFNEVSHVVTVTSSAAPVMRSSKFKQTVQGEDPKQAGLPGIVVGGGALPVPTDGDIPGGARVTDQDDEDENPLADVPAAPAPAKRRGRPPKAKVDPELPAKPEPPAAGADKGDDPFNKAFESDFKPED